MRHLWDQKWSFFLPPNIGSASGEQGTVEEDDPGGQLKAGLTLPQPDRAESCARKPRSPPAHPLALILPSVPSRLTRGCFCGIFFFFFLDFPFLVNRIGVF